ncbi:ArsR/SmtB family transcription factor [Arsenicibacter rosenii]|uniref:HTH arsR-type domain-containing protein n=1 Tax=Arsenicibacter rosenii TaxID=1750698 RepID=A0A1S2V9L1_9BACT|nr:metalloregulator ArsR/SmtB family transcription factor [Arsenicibacter rosenii]OIN55427.1 hypothetical protein BLX24_30955 [Arsenicibacter rosenii]
MISNQKQPIERTAHVLKSLAHPIRMQIIMLLRGGERELSVTAIQEKLSVSQSLASHHLSLLRTKGVLNVRTNGTERYYSLKDLRFAQSIATLFEK